MNLQSKAAILGSASPEIVSVFCLPMQKAQFVGVGGGLGF